MAHQKLQTIKLHLKQKSKLNYTIPYFEFLFI